MSNCRQTPPCWSVRLLRATSTRAAPISHECAVPDSERAAFYCRLGEAFFYRGQREAALDCARAAFELQPQARGDRRFLRLAVQQLRASRRGGGGL